MIYKVQGRRGAPSAAQCKSCKAPHVDRGVRLGEPRCAGQGERERPVSRCPKGKVARTYEIREAIWITQHPLGGWENPPAPRRPYDDLIIHLTFRVKAMARRNPSRPCQTGARPTLDAHVGPSVWRQPRCRQPQQHHVRERASSGTARIASSYHCVEESNSAIQFSSTPIGDLSVVRALRVCGWLHVDGARSTLLLARLEFEGDGSPLSAMPGSAADATVQPSCVCLAS